MKNECLLTQTQADVECLITPGRALGFRFRKDCTVLGVQCPLWGQVENTLIP